MFPKSCRTQSGSPTGNVLPRPTVTPSTASPTSGYTKMSRDSSSSDLRRRIVDQITRDCYNKVERVDGKKVLETKYNTHLHVHEFSQYPQRPPPADLSSTQIGSVKSRILVICTKNSGRVLLQKGKYNNDIKIYQIGRTWDLEELKCVNIVSADSMILLLNKDYYWLSGEEPERLQKFLHRLLFIYHRFTGRYPELRGATLARLGFADQKSPSIKYADTRPAPKAQDLAILYRDMDFTANCKLPMKPMQIMDVDRPGKKSHGRSPTQQSSVVREISTISAPNRSKFLQDAFFNSPGPEKSNTSPARSSSLNENKPDLAKPKHSECIPRQSGRSSPLLPLRNSITIEEFKSDGSILLVSSSGERPLSNAKPSRGSIQGSRPVSMLDDTAINTSIREIEDFMFLQFGSQKRFNGNHRRNKLLQVRLDDFDDATSTFSADNGSFVEKAGTPFSDLESIQVPVSKMEKDAEVDELLDEIGWKVTEDSDVFVRQLSRELEVMKRKNVSQLINLDFGKDKLSIEGKVCTDEIDNLLVVFKKMEVAFQKIAPGISDLESNSKGLQVEAVNKKILFNDLNEILSKVKVNNLDLLLVSNFDDFADLVQIPILETKLLTLYDALNAIGSKDSGEGLGQMKALKQYQEKYVNVASCFVSRFASFINDKFVKCVAELSRNIDLLFPRNILSALMDLTAYVGVEFFSKCVSAEEALALNDNFNSILADFLSKYYDSRLKLASAGQKSKCSRLSQGHESIDGLGKRRSSRFGSTKLISRLSSGDEEQPKTEVPRPAQNSKETTRDPRTVLRMVQETRELILVVQFFCCNFFHPLSTNNYSDFVAISPFDERQARFSNPDLYLIDYKTNSNELLQNMNAVFGNYINKIVKTFTPVDIQIPQLLLDLSKLLAEALAQYQDFVAYSFLRKLIDRYKNLWIKFIAQNVAILQKSDIRAKSSLLPGVKNLNVIVLTTESTLQGSKLLQDDASVTEVFSMINDSYSQLADAMVDLFGREDPLLKYNSHDEKERAHRNVAILQNLFSTLQQLGEFGNAAATASMNLKLQSVFGKVQSDYTTYLLRRFYAKMVEFVALNSDTDAALKKKDNKILVKALVSSYTPKEMSVKVLELHHKLERHFLTSNSVLEQDLLSVMWKYTEDRVVDLFLKFHSFAKAVDRDLDDCITISAVRNLFKTCR